MNFCKAVFDLRMVCVCVVFLGSSAAVADSIHMKNGDVLSGRLVSYRDGFCVFSTNYDAAIRVRFEDILGITTDDVYQALFSNGDILSGRIVYSQDHNFIESESLGKIQASVGSIKELTRVFSKQLTKADVGASVNGGDKVFGEEDEKHAPLDFLTGSTILLAPGKYEVDFGISHKNSHESYSLPVAGYFQRSSYSARQLVFGATLRAGIANNVEGWISVPFGYTNIEQVSTNEYVRQNESWNIGDISFGAGYQLSHETAKLPAISTTLAVSAPTGKKRYRDLTKNWLDPSDTGSGHWTVSPGVSFVRTTDPAILFGGVNFQYSAPRKIDGYRIKPGWGAGFYIGMGFALNEHLSFGTRISYSHQSRIEVDGQKIYGSDSDPVDISFSASYRLYDGLIATPQVTFGLNDDAGKTAMSIRLRKQF